MTSRFRTLLLMVMSSANFTIRFLLGSAICMSLTIKENKMGARTVPRGTPLLISINSVVILSTTTLCFLWLKKSRPVDHVGIYICCFNLVREDVMRNSIECLAEVEWQYPYKVCVLIQPFQLIMLGLQKRHCGIGIFFVGELIRSYEWLEDVKKLKLEY